MREYIIIGYVDKNMIISSYELNRTIIFNVIFKKLLKIQKILETVNLLSEESIRNLTMYIEVDISNKEREILECINRKQNYDHFLVKMQAKEKKVLGLFTSIIKFLEKAIKKRKNIDYSFTIDNTVCRENTEKINNLDDNKLKKIAYILAKLKVLTDVLIQNKSVNITEIMKQLKKLEDKVYDEANYESIAVTVNSQDELSLSI